MLNQVSFSCVASIIIYIPMSFQETVRDLEEQLEQEEQARQKMQLDKVNVDQRAKAVESKLVELQDSHDKILKEKRILEEKANQLAQQLTEEEERHKHAAKQRGKVSVFHLLFLIN